MWAGCRYHECHFPFRMCIMQVPMVWQPDYRVPPPFVPKKKLACMGTQNMPGCAPAQMFPPWIHYIYQNTAIIILILLHNSYRVHVYNYEKVDAQHSWKQSSPQQLWPSAIESAMTSSELKVSHCTKWHYYALVRCLLSWCMKTVWNEYIVVTIRF